MPRALIGPTSRRWLFTLFNYTGDQEEALWAMSDSEKRLEYAVWQAELCPTTMRPHIQGYVILIGHAKPMAYMQNMLRCTWKIANGTTEQNYVYCTKPGNLAGPWEYGIKPIDKSGKRNDLLAVKGKLDKGVPMSLIAEENFCSFIRYETSFRSYLNIISPKRDKKTQVIIMVGAPGTGKSTCAKNHTKDPYTVFSEKWFNGYNGTSDIIINDFTGWIELRILLQMLDEGPWTVEIKGSVVNWNPKRIIITSNFIYEQWYDYVKIRGMASALRRRFTYYFNEAIPEDVIFFDNDWWDAQNIPNVHEEPDVISEGEICEEDALGRLILPQSSPPWSQADTWDEEDVGHALDSDYWERHLGENDADLADPHAIPFLDIEALEEALVSADID